MTHKHEHADKLIIVPKMMSFEDCCEAIKYHAENLSNYQSSALINYNRYKTLKSLLNLFKIYNDQLRRLDEVHGDIERRKDEMQI